MVTIANRVGRLLEITSAPPVTAAEIEAFARELRGRHAHIDRVVVVANLSAVDVLDAELAERIEAVMLEVNPRLERSATLLPSTAVGSLQTARLFREAGHTMRRGFHAIEPLLEWIAPSLGAEERAAARAFLARR
jgi:hypothetical protein